MKILLGRLFAVLAVLISAQTAHAEDYFLTIAGGYSPTGNQVSLEKNVLFFERVLEDLDLAERPWDVYFGDGFKGGRSLQVKDVDSVPLPNRLMAELFGSTRNLGMTYRPHKVPNLRGATSKENIQNWFHQNGKKMKSGDRLFLYVSAHGGSSKDKSKPHDTTIYLWNRQTIKVSELVSMLDSLPEGVNVVTVMVQCHAGGFARICFDQLNPESGVSKQNRIGFFATVHSRPAAGCTPEINEANYEEYSTYFLAALSGQTRTGEPVQMPDYNGDGAVSFDEAHAYCVLTSNTIDLPIKTSGEFLRGVSKFANDDDTELLTKNADYSQVLELADPIDRSILEGLSKQLELTGEDRIARARKEGAKRTSRSGRNRSRTTSSESYRIKRKIADDLKKQWPELANVMNPLAVDLLTNKPDEFVQAVENHPSYQRYRELKNKPGTSSTTATKAKVKYERFVRIAENVILKNNLAKTGDVVDMLALERILASEAQVLVPPTTPGN